MLSAAGLEYAKVEAAYDLDRYCGDLVVHAPDDPARTNIAPSTGSGGSFPIASWEMRRRRSISWLSKEADEALLFSETAVWDVTAVTNIFM